MRFLKYLLITYFMRQLLSEYELFPNGYGFSFYSHYFSPSLVLSAFLVDLRIRKVWDSNIRPETA
jgi:hypothetical protein